MSSIQKPTHAEYQVEILEKRVQKLKMRINDALIVAKDGQIDGAHHKTWVIDQIVRTLTGCPTVDKEALDGHGQTYVYKGLGESKIYKKFIRKVRYGKDGPHTYDWDEGIPP